MKISHGFLFAIESVLREFMELFHTYSINIEKINLKVKRVYGEILPVLYTVLMVLQGHGHFLISGYKKSAIFLL